MSAMSLLRRPHAPIAATMILAGVPKVAGAQFTRENFARWGYPDSLRPIIGAVEVSTGAVALLAPASTAARRLAAAGTLATMGGAIATHTIASDSAPWFVPPVLLAGLGYLLLGAERTAES